MPVYKSVEILNGMMKMGEVLYPAGTDASLHQVVLSSEIDSLMFYVGKGDVLCLKYEHRKMALLLYCPDPKDTQDFQQHYSATAAVLDDLLIVDMHKVTNVVYSMKGAVALYPVQKLSLPVMRGGRFNTLHTVYGNTVRFADVNACGLVTWEVSPRRHKYISYFSPEKVLHQIAEFHFTYSRITGLYTAQLGHQAYVMILQTQGPRTNLHFMQTKYKYDRLSFCCMYYEVAVTSELLAMVSGTLGETKGIRSKTLQVPWHLLHPCVHPESFFCGLNHPNYYAVCHRILVTSLIDQNTFSKVLIPAGVYTNFSVSFTVRRAALPLREVSLVGAGTHVVPQPLHSTPPAIDPLLSQSANEDEEQLDVDELEVDYTSDPDPDTDFAVSPIPYEIAHFNS